ncbi:MAG TPA: hypothetical protein VKR42_08240, partial [Ktedonobacteraceae bacterium]|nr:hypothetical protein [Ktedonobacteraceae bacterium]
PLRQFNSAVPPSVERIVMHTLEKEPNERFHSAAEMEQTLRACARELSRRNQFDRVPARNSSMQYPGNAMPGPDGKGPGTPGNRQYPS